MIFDKIAPENPIKPPAMINNYWSNMNPEAAVAHPEHEFNMDTTTGISAPPMAIIQWNPRNNDNPVITSKTIRD